MQQVISILNEFNGWSVCFRLLLAAVFGGCIGAERGRHGRPAGLRTYILVSVGACITTLIGLYSVSYLNLSGDPLRIGAQVVSGIGFLGAGTIMSDRNANITGLTTAAGLWTIACIGLAIGMGFYWGASIAFLIMSIAVVALTRLEKTQKSSLPAINYYLEVEKIQHVKVVYNELEGFGTFQITIAKSGLPGHIGMILNVEANVGGETFLKRLQSIDNVVVAIPVTL